MPDLAAASRAEVPLAAPPWGICDFSQKHLSMLVLAEERVEPSRYSSSIIYLVSFHPLAKFPGPKWWAVSRITGAYDVIEGDLWAVLDGLHEKYGAHSSNRAPSNDNHHPAAWKYIYVTKPVLMKDTYGLTPPVNGAHSLFTAEGGTHRRLRGALVNGFADRSLRDQKPIAEGYGNQLIALFRREAAKSADGTVVIQRMYGYATFDTVTNLSFGESLLNTFESDTGNDEIRDFFLHAKFSTIRNCLSRFSQLDIFLRLFLFRVSRKTRERNWRLTTEKINRWLTRSDLLAPLVGKLDETGGVKGIIIIKAELTTNQLAFVIADCQLTTVALAMVTYLLLRDPPKWQQLVEEIRGHLTSNDQITVLSTQELAYLEAVNDGTMRFRHPTPISFRDASLQKDRRSTASEFPAINIQTTPTLWVEQHAFHPERFLPQSDPRFHAVLSWPAKLPGFKVKMFLAKARVFLAKVVWNFDLVMLENQEDCLDQKVYLLFEPKPLVKLSIPGDATRM
ncbi:cytochrome P450 [Parathielavia appendiculata]|uniref:Cytochrome P450 n=1 Tax=Parathielavia appendiculata TaxID=2587402 RepID=A0AAN6Z083_9PEZI|nr:cytochrome P450 [Parathielavia appendiculata]